MEKIDTSMNVETTIFKKYKQYMIDKSSFKPNVFNKAPQSLSKFPTIVFKESNNTEDINYTTLDRSESVNAITDVINIYTKDMTLNGKRYASKEIMNELKYLTFDFFNAWGFTRTQAKDADYLNYEVDRYVIIETASVNNWNKKINL